VLRLLLLLLRLLLLLFLPSRFYLRNQHPLVLLRVPKRLPKRLEFREIHPVPQAQESAALVLPEPS